MKKKLSRIIPIFVIVIAILIAACFLFVRNSKNSVARYVLKNHLALEKFLLEFHLTADAYNQNAYNRWDVTYWPDANMYEFVVAYLYQKAQHKHNARSSSSSRYCHSREIVEGQK